MHPHKWNLILTDMGEEEYRSEKIVTYGKKSFRIVKVNKHIQVFDANSKAKEPKALYDSERDGGHYFRWLREKARN